MAFKLSDVTLALSGLVGNRGTAYAAGAGAATTSALEQAGGRLREALNKAGAKIGPVLGTAIPEQLAAGAATTGAAAQNGVEAKYLGFSLPQIAMYGGAAAVVLLLIWMFRATRRR